MITKSLLEGVDLSLDGFNPPLYDLEHRDYVESLRTALIAALRVIDAWREIDEAKEQTAILNAGYVWSEANKELESALRVFRKEGV